MSNDDGGGGVVPHGRRCSLSDRGMAAMAESLQQKNIKEK